MRRVFIASLATETNTFSPTPTTLEDYQLLGIHRDASVTGEAPYAAAMVRFREKALESGYEVVESITAFAQPAGPTTREAYVTLVGEILRDLQGSGTFDLVLLALHGAMIAEHCDDCEGDLIARVRELQPDAVIGVELDLHCHLTRAMVEAADFLITFKEYPHVDIGGRAIELFDACKALLDGEYSPTAALLDMGMIGIFPTSHEVMQGVVELARKIERKPDIVSVSIGHGFPWADVKDVGARILVYGRTRDAAIEAAKEIAEAFYASRFDLQPNYPDIPSSLDKAAGLDGLVVLGDIADNPGGGAPGDSTFFLREMLERDTQQAVIGAFHDPDAVACAEKAGVGAKIEIQIGGKEGPVSGVPVRFEAQVMALVASHRQSCFGGKQPMGSAAWLRSGGIDILATTIRAQVYEPDLFTGAGITLKDKRLIVCKSSTHFEAGFRPIADHLWRVTSAGALNMDFGSLPYTKRDGCYFPRIDDPWQRTGPRLETFEKRSSN